MRPAPPPPPPQPQPPPVPPHWAPDSTVRQASLAPRSRTPVLVVLVLLGLFATAIGVGQLAHLRLPDLAGLFDGAGSSTGTPRSISIPSLDVRARVVAVGRADDGSIGVPTQDPVRTAGWYDHGPQPGDPGTAGV